MRTGAARAIMRRSTYPKGTAMATTYEVGKKLVDLCREGKHLEAISTLYAPNIVSVEAMSSPQMPARQEGLAAIKAKGEWWEANHTVHSAKVEGPYPNGDRFIVRFTYDVTAKTGPMAGARFQMDEA